MSSDFDVFVIGGGPAGLATAIAAAQRAIESRRGRRVGPGHRQGVRRGPDAGLRRGAGRAGVTVPESAGHPFPGLRFLGSGIAVDARFPSGTGLGVRRTVLHDLLSVEAARSGVEMLWKTRGRWSKGGPGRVRRPVVPRALDRRRRRRPVLRAPLAGLDACRRDEHRYGFRRHYGIAPWSEFMELYWGDNDRHEACQIYVTPVGPQEVCVALLSRNPQLRLDQAVPGSRGWRSG